MSDKKKAVKKNRTVKVTKDNVANIHNAIVGAMGVDEQLTQSDIPLIVTTNQELKKQGEWFLQNDLGSQYINTLQNRISFEIIKNMLAVNPFSRFKKSQMELGDTIEEIFVEIAKPHLFDSMVAEDQLFKRELAEVLTKFHKLNTALFYKVSVDKNSLRKYFTSFAQLENLVTKLIDSLYNGCYYDEYLHVVYMLGRAILNGDVATVNVGDLTPSNLNSLVSTIKETTSDFKLVSSRFNSAGVKNTCPTDQQFLFQSTAFSSKIDVEVLANAFNVGKVEFLPEKIEYNKFSDIDFSRLDELYKNNPQYIKFTPEELVKLDKVHCVLASENWLMIYPFLFEMESPLFNPQNRVFNYFLHLQQVYSYSPFENVVAFTGFDVEVPSFTEINVLDFDGSILGMVDRNANYTLQLLPETQSDNYLINVVGNTSRGTYVNFGRLFVGADENGTNDAIELVVVARDGTVLVNSTVAINKPLVPPVAVFRDEEVKEDVKEDVTPEVKEVTPEETPEETIE